MPSTFSKFSLSNCSAALTTQHDHKSLDEPAFCWKNMLEFIYRQTNRTRIKLTLLTILADILGTSSTVSRLRGLWSCKTLCKGALQPTTVPMLYTFCASRLKPLKYPYTYGGAHLRVLYLYEFSKYQHGKSMAAHKGKAIYTSSQGMIRTLESVPY